ncbi:MFS transporter [Thermocatellispora tengchongensis]
MGGARVTLWNFVAMAGAVLLVGYGLSVHNFALFFGSYMLLVASTGVGNGSTYRMIPAIFRAKATAGLAKGTEAYEAAAIVGRRNAAAAVGIISAIGAYGGFFINRGFGSSIAATGGAGAALTAFALFYAACFVLTWACYLRKVGAGTVPSLAAARI